jgi:sensor histidine kinase regulating citrate/malate metabolism
MIEKSSLQIMTHELSNKLMILEGYITLMQLDEKHINTATIQILAETLRSATETLSNFKSSEAHGFVSPGNKK